MKDVFVDNDTSLQASGSDFGNGAAVEALPADAGAGVVAGQVKWFDGVRGYGFMVPEDGGGDVLVHYNLLTPYGRKTLPEGTRVIATVRAGARGRQAQSLLSIDLSTATGPDADRIERNNANRVDPLKFIDQAGGFEPVTVRWFNRARGYGFLLASDAQTQIFVHMETVRRGGFETLTPGQGLQARVFHGPKGDLAVVVAAPVSS
ncbi:MAG: cold shock domain-containing protein [Sphingomonadaceae bacterium]